MKSPKRKENWRNFEKIVNNNRISKLYHFTPYENYTSIIDYGGLYSKDYCERNNIPIQICGGSSLSKHLDLIKNLGNYIHLSFQPYPPMFYVKNKIKDKIIKNYVILEISPFVIYWKKTMFSNENAVSRNAIIGAELEHFKAIHFNKAKRSFMPYYDFEDEKKYHQAEVLVEEHIPIKYIKIKELV